MKIGVPKCACVMIFFYLQLYSMAATNPSSVVSPSLSNDTVNTLDADVYGGGVTTPLIGNTVFTP